MKLKLIVMLDLEDNYKGQMYNKISRYYEKNHHYQKPVIIDKSDFVFDGSLPGTASAYRKVKKGIEDVSNEYKYFYSSETDLSIGGE